MWFIGVVVAAATGITVLVYGCAFYLEHAAAARQKAELTAAVPLPPKAPARPNVQRARLEPPPEIVREPKQAWSKSWSRTWSGNSRGWNARKSWSGKSWSGKSWSGKSWSKARTKSRQARWHETW